MKSSMVSVRTATAANASGSEPDAVISRVGESLTYSGTRAGTTSPPLP